MSTRHKKDSAYANLKSALATLVGADLANWSDDPNEAVTDPYGKAMIAFGVESNADLLNLSFDDIESMDDLNKVQQNRVKILISMFHHVSRLCGNAYSLNDITKKDYDLYRISEYVPGAPLSVWTTPTPGSKRDSSGTDAVATWKKSIKPTASAYKEFKDAAYFSIWKEKFKSTAESQGIGHLLDPEYIVTNPELDEIQSKWMYKVLEDMCVERSARAIVLEYKNKSHDVRGLWKALCDKFSKAIETDLKIQRLTAYIVGANFSNSNWRGTQTNMILHYKEQVRLYEELAPKSEHYTDVQLNRFLNQAVMGVENLAQVKSLYENQQLAAGNSTELSFNKYVELLMVQCGIYDASKGKKVAAQNRKVNVHVFDDVEEDAPQDFDEDFDPETDVEDILEAMQHNASYGTNSKNNGTNGNYKSPYNKSSGPRKVFMNINTWRELSPSDQKGWDAISEEGKKKVSEYWINRGKLLGKDPQQYNNNSRAINQHDVSEEENLIFEEEQEISVNKHKTEVSDSKKEATVKTHKTENGNKKLKPKTLAKPISINMSRILSTNKKARDSVPEVEVNMADRSDLTPVEEREVFMMRSFFGSDSEEDDDEVQVLSYIDAIKARQAEKERKRREAKEQNNPKTPEAKPETQQTEIPLSEGFVKNFEDNTNLSTPADEDIEEDTKPPPLDDITDDLTTEHIKKEPGSLEDDVDTPSYASVATSTPYYSVDSKGSISNEVLLKATKEEIEVLKKYGVITQVTDVSSTWRTPMKSEFTVKEDTPSKRKSNQITDKSELIQDHKEPKDDAENQATTKESDATPESSENTTEDGFKPVSNKKGRRRSVDELANLKTTMNFSSKGNRKTRNSQRFAVLEDETHVEEDSDFHKAESV